MRCVNVITPTRNYSVVIAGGLLPQTGNYIREFAGVRTAAVISDDTVWELYGNTVRDSLEKSGFYVPSMVFPHGEKSKNASTLIEILEFLASENLVRSDMVIALGGGVVGDISGLAASMYLRGIRYVQIPTTVLAAVDSSVGGKCAVDLSRGKNLAGAFWQPSLVLCDYSALDSLDGKVYADGCAEIIKYGVIGDSDFFDSLGRVHVSERPEYVITKCVSMKRDIVSADETDAGVRQLLNFGHTAAHAIEKCSDFKISHGSAVAAGMMYASKYAEKINFCKEKDCSRRIKNMLDFYGLPAECGFSPEELCRAALSDKKRSGESINLILPEKLGRCEIHKIGTSNLIEFFRS